MFNFDMRKPGAYASAVSIFANATRLISCCIFVLHHTVFHCTFAVHCCNTTLCAQPLNPAPYLEKMKNPRYFGGFCLERMMGVEPTYAAWEAAVLPMIYTRK